MKEPVQPLASINGIETTEPRVAEPLRSKSELPRAESALHRRIVQIIASGDWEAALQPNSRRSVNVLGHHVCVSYHDEAEAGRRVWQWQGHIFVYDGAMDYVPEYIYGHHIQPLPGGTGNVFDDPELLRLSDIILNAEAASKGPGKSRTKLGSIAQRNVAEQCTELLLR